MLRYLDGILAVDPDAHEERWIRAVFRYQLGQRAGSLEDCEHLLKAAPESVDLGRVRELRQAWRRSRFHTDRSCSGKPHFVNIQQYSERICG